MGVSKIEGSINLEMHNLQSSLQYIMLYYIILGIMITISQIPMSR